MQIAGGVLFHRHLMVPVDASSQEKGGAYRSRMRHRLLIG